MNYIKDLYYGNMNSSIQKFSNNSQYSNLMKREAGIYDELTGKLGDKESKMLKDFCELQSHINDITSIDNYATGFRDGAKLMIDVLLGRNENLNNN